MVLRNAEAPLEVQIPREGADRPAWAKVGVITALGFVLGVAWPRVAGVRVGPSLPEATSSATASAASADPVESLPPSSSAAPAQVPPVAAALATAPAAPRPPSPAKLPPPR